MNNSAAYRPVVSFCIPVYNRADIVRQMVEGLLVSDDPRFDVVLCDNASEENIPEAIAHIHDPRLKYYRNDTNIGSFQNWLKSLELGEGEYLYLAMGRDRLDGKHIGRLMEILEYARDNNISYLRDGDTRKEEIQVFEGIDAMSNLVNILHPTGSIFDRELFRQIPDKAALIDIVVNQHKNAYPENYLRHYVLLHGKGAKINSGIFYYPDPLIDLSKVLSTSVPLKGIESMYFHPVVYTAECLDLIDLIDSDRPDVFSEEDTDKFFKARFQTILYLVGDEWRENCADPGRMLHYGQKLRHVGTIEIIKNILQAYRNTKAHLMEKGTYSRSRQKIMYKCILQRMYGAVYRTSKTILKPLGIWSILKFCKRLIKGDTVQS